MNEKAFGAIERSLAMLGFLRADTITEEMARAELANARKLLEAAKKIKPCRRTIAMDIAIRDCGVESNA